MDVQTTADREITLLGAPHVDVRWEVSRNKDADWSPVEHDDERETHLRIELPADQPSDLDHAYAMSVVPIESERSQD